jgi:hypothetical protein
VVPESIIDIVMEGNPIQYLLIPNNETFCIYDQQADYYEQKHRLSNMINDYFFEIQQCTAWDKVYQTQPALELLFRNSLSRELSSCIGLFVLDRFFISYLKKLKIEGTCSKT